jgi:hypothetical protein
MNHNENVSLNPTEPIGEEMQRLLDAFIDADDMAEMAELLEEYPLLAEEAFAQNVARLIEHAARMGESEAMLRLQSRMELLDDILDQDASPLELAVQDYLLAPDEEEAASIFQEEADLLRSDEAEQMLFTMEAVTPADQAHLDQRQRLWRQLMASV